MYAWRLQRMVHDPLDGEGARRYGGRWNRSGHPVVYAAESLALAVLELLVHIDSDLVPVGYGAYCIDIPDDVRLSDIEREQLPPDWHRAAFCRECVQIGSGWLSRAETAVLRVPTAVVPAGSNILINPLHADARRITVKSAAPFDFDPRLF